MEPLTDYIDELAAGREPEPEQLAALIWCEDRETCEQLYAAAYAVKLQEVGPYVRPRALIEVSNQCRCNCYYCGIRAGNRNVARYSLTMDEIIAAAEWACAAGYGSMVLQAGEQQSELFTAFIEEALLAIKKLSNGALGITLSLGEQSAETYARWFAAGAHRYLLRIETANPALFAQLHPAEQRFEDRAACLYMLRACGYQVGTGVMIGLPGQTAADLAADIAFFKEIDADMFGMGPYLVHHDTPLGAAAGTLDTGRQLQLGLNMIAVIRLLLRDVNIAATTALQTIDPRGRELGLKAGANVIMPNISPLRFRNAYALYEGKPACDETDEQSSRALEQRIADLGETLVYGDWGDAPHFKHRAQAHHISGTDFDTLVGGRA